MWEVIGLKADNTQCVLSVHPLKEEAEQQRLSFLDNGLQGYQELFVERKEDRIARRTRNVTTLQAAMDRNPPVDPVQAMRHNLQLALFESIAGNDVAAIVAKLKEKAAEGDLRAMRLFFDLVTQGPPTVQQAVVVEERRPKKGRRRHIDEDGFLPVMD